MHDVFVAALSKDTITSGEFTHHAFCDGTLCVKQSSPSYIKGTHYRCAICEDTDFCDHCASEHDSSHNLVRYGHQDDTAYINSAVYQYTSPLEPGHVQILELLPGPYHEEVSFYLWSVALNEHLITPYEALSYTWGDPAVTTKVYCNGQAFCVTMNLHEALCRNRLQTESRMLWIDAICIDHSDTTERGKQVELMAEIYRRAKRVLICLGPGADGSDEALE